MKPKNKTFFGRALTSRRAILKAGAAAGALGAAGLASSGTAVAAGETEAGPRSYDAIVIGGGFAGVAAARELKARGKRTLILEARDRVGGRAWSSTFSGLPIEFGATWIHPSQTLIWNEVQRLGIATVDDPNPDFTVFATESGGYARHDLTFLDNQDALLRKFVEGAQEYLPRAYDPFYREDLLVDLDKLTLGDRARQLRLSTLEQNWVSATTGAYGGGFERGSLTQLAHWWALCGYNTETFHGINVTRPVGGMSGVIRKMLAESGATVVYKAPVTKVADTGSRVQVTAGGVVYDAAAVVVAVPANVWNTINFSSGLPAEFSRMSSQTVGVPTAKKVFIQVQGDIGRPLVNGKSGAPLDLVLAHADTSSQGSVLIGFSVNPNLDANSVSQVQSAISEVLPGTKVLSVKGHDWGKDAYAKGGWTFRRPGQLLGLLRAVRQPHGRLVFAGSDIATGWGGYVDGAIETGIRAAGLAADLTVRYASATS
ncbi:FAD-dependent oxidoreductase [Streptomyces luteolifulvus]|uniref:FAD-dependent oxidoreductase n=1 Tax=Streptomyces luteolifulvus TaxID=2615112 RepID=A0A6H9UXP0_9ACTN|nr:NAD(P)/FAD-dependent oxidoreductase [Streptomyces luteolifulvus]KAB1144802.1 FAD-dependent oxidoreductase [Streptomyces luteolifulvus]